MVRLARRARTPRRFLLLLTALALAVAVAPAAVAAPNAPAGACTITGTPGNDTLPGTDGPDVICGGDGNDTINGGGGGDVLRGEGGDDTLTGGNGDDTIDGGAGADTASYLTAAVVRADLGSGAAAGDGSDDLIQIENLTGSPGNDILRGDDGPNRLRGGSGIADVLLGGGGGDVLLGEGGGDYLGGGDGDDALDGGPNVNTCVQGGGSGPVSNCLTPSPSDGNDSPSALDIRRVLTNFAPAEPLWTVLTHDPFTPRQIWDRGYILVRFDTVGSYGLDYNVILWSDGERINAVIHNDNGGRVGSGAVDLVGNDGVRVTNVLSKLQVDNGRGYYRWAVETLYTNVNCQDVCFDRAPNSSWMIQPL